MSQMEEKVDLNDTEHLSCFEKEEIKGYIARGVVFYTGKRAEAKFSGKFEDYNFDYILIRGSHIVYRYEVLNKLGSGASGQVIAAYDHKNNTKVAIKIVRKGKMYGERALKEIKVLEYINLSHNNHRKELEHMLDHFLFRGHYCIVLELNDRDLFCALQANHFKGFETKMLKEVTISILKGLLALHQINILHGDLKLNNLMFRDSICNDIRLIDMGNAKFGVQEFSSHEDGRYYRAPEKILHLNYGSSVDIWAAGCVVFELATGEVLFKGDTKQDQLVRIMEVFGLPPKEMIESSTAANKYFRVNGEPLYCRFKKNIDLKKEKSGELRAPSGSRRKLPGKRDFKAMMCNYDPVLVDFIEACLKWNPQERLTAQEALNHHWLLEDSLIDYKDDKPPQASSSSSNLLKDKKQTFSCASNAAIPRKSPLSDEHLPALNLKWTYVCARYLKEETYYKTLRQDY